MPDRPQPDSPQPDQADRDFPPLPPEAERLARETFGWEDGLTEAQVEAVSAVAAGRDVLAIWPTGAGKSAVFQVGGLLRGGTTLVVSPLLALAGEQVEWLQEHGVTAAMLSGGTRTADLLRRIADGEFSFVYTSPEQLGREDVGDALREADVRLVAVDEAHCLSWWADFRPDYLRVPDALALLGHPQVVAATATASIPVRLDIVDRLEMRDPVEVVRGMRRDDIDLAVVSVRREEDARAEAVGLVAAETAPTLLYVPTRRMAEELTTAVEEAGRTAAAYHAGLRTKEREEVHTRWLDGDLEVVVATKAFGMGVDKPDVRLVVHAAPPDSPDTYLQEIGRGGRDEGGARAVLVYRPEAMGMQRFFAMRGDVTGPLSKLAEALQELQEPMPRTTLGKVTGLGPRRVTRLINLLELAGAIEIDERGRVSWCRPRTVDAAQAAVAEAQRQREVHEQVELARVELMRGYAETDDCRTAYLMACVGEPMHHRCGHCDRCREAGDGALVPENAWAPGTRLHHDEFGDGIVLGATAEGQSVVMFPRTGLRTLHVQTVVEHDLVDVPS